MLEYILESINSIEVNTVGSVFKLVLSMLLGSVIGYERKRKGQSAGVRDRKSTRLNSSHWS